MPSSPSLPAPRPAPTTPRPLWSFRTAGRPRGLCLARETGSLLAWDDKDWLYLLDRRGERQAQLHLASSPAAACISDDGTALAAVDSRGEVSWLALDLATRWQRTLSSPAVAAALDPLGQYLAVADAGARLHLIDRRGRVHFLVQTHRPLHHLAFVPEAPRLVGCADFGLVACFDPDGRCLWRDGLVAHLGALAVSGDGMCLALACFTEGLRFYGLDGSKQGSLPLPESCRLVNVTFDGRFLLAGGASNHLLLRGRDGHAIADLVLDMPPVALALAPLGAAGVIALPDGRLLGLDLPDAAPR